MVGAYGLTRERLSLCLCIGTLGVNIRICRIEGGKLLTLARKHCPGLAVAARADPARTLEGGAEGERAAIADLAGDRVQGGVGGDEQVGRVR